MDRRYSPISDLYGPAPEEEPPKRKSHNWLYVLLALAGFFVFESLHPVMRLRSDPPPSVVGARLSQDQSQNESQSRMARACWDYAIESVQYAYPFGKSLPNNVPPRLKGSTGKPPEISVLCWPRLRDAWNQPESWVEKYEWSTTWITDPDSSFRQTLRKVTNALGINY
jgi:hypothetical protein